MKAFFQKYCQEIALILVFSAIVAGVYFQKDDVAAIQFAVGGLVGLIGGLFLKNRLEKRYVSDKLVRAAPWVFMLSGFIGGIIALIVVGTIYILIVSKKSMKKSI